MADPLLQVADLTTMLGQGEHALRVVDHLSFALYPGETFALLGESGCGKSMTALSLMRLLPPNGRIVDGRAYLTGVDLLDLPEREMRTVRGGRMAMIFQEPQTSLNPVLTVGRQIAEAVELHDPQAVVKTRVVELLRAVGIPDPERRAGEYPHQLSGGMKQRIMMAMALAGRPDLLIADEPTTALDVTIQAQVLALLKELQAASGMAVLLITHDLGVVAETADRLAVMYAGELVEMATRATFFRQPAHPYSRMLFDALPSARKRDHPLATILGRVPPLNQKFSGCRFAERCPAILPLCREQAPPWCDSGMGGHVRCHRWAQHLGSSVLPIRTETPISTSFSPPPANESLLEVDDLKVHFPLRRGLFQRAAGAVRAVDGVSLVLKPGRTLALVGESGCGKTSVGKAILQLPPPTAGSVRFRGQELTEFNSRRLRPLRREIQIIFQDPFAAMNPRMRVASLVEEGLLAQNLGGTRTQRREQVRVLLEQVGLGDEALDRYPHEFSGGQRQRICIARALAVEPKLLICDEPTSALDVSVQAQIINLLKGLQEKLGLAYLFITHNLAVVAYLAHEVAVMYLGRIVERGTAQEVLESPRHPYTRALLAAVPRLDARGGREHIHLEGDLPSPADPPMGCHFHPRCPEARPACRQTYPAPVALSSSHSAHCLRI